MQTYNCDGITSKAWEAIEKGYDTCKQKYPDITFDKNGFSKFKANFENRYNDIMQRFMKSQTEALDSHKQAALITICCLESNIIKHPLEDPNKISIIPQFIAVNAGLSYMNDCINVILREKEIQEKIDRYYLPIAMTCDTKYDEIICRILYYEQNENDMDFNVLELADRYFLIEYINLLQQNIEPFSLKQNEWERVTAEVIEN